MDLSRDSGYLTANSQEPLEEDFFRGDEAAQRQVLHEVGDQNLEIAYDMQHNIRHIAHDIFDLRNELRVIDIIGNTVRGARKVGLLVLRRASGFYL